MTNFTYIRSCISFLGFRCTLILFFHVTKNCTKLYTSHRTLLYSHFTSLHRRCGMSPVFRCIWHSVPAHRAFQANISIVKNETETCISSDLIHFNELTKVYLLAVCKAHILNSSLQKCQTASFFLSQALSNDQTKWVQLC